ncbi:glycosyl hydrolase [Paraphysoderma sedebokerense]|nr:glycosyl hydrolase [Paraphysoderma sedebokerense]
MIRSVAALFAILSLFLARSFASEMDVPMKRLPSDVDEHRPIYHFVSPRSWMNDPILFYNDKDQKYHLFYQFSAQSAVWQPPLLWGHAVSKDMIRWKDLPVAIKPSIEDDKLSIFTGSVLANGYKGYPTAFYTGITRLPLDIRADYHWGAETQVLAYSTDPDLNEWTKLPQAVIPGPPKPFTVTGFRDPFVFRSEKLDSMFGKEGGYYMVVSGGLKGKGQATFFYRSYDLVNWIENGKDGKIEPMYWHEMEEESVYFGLNMECASLMEFGEDVMLLFGAQVSTAKHYEHAAIYALGNYTYDADNNVLRYVAEHYSRFDHGYVYAFNQHRLSSDNRVITMGWIPEEGDGKPKFKHAWAGMQTLPREISIEKQTVYNPTTSQPTSVSTLTIRPMKETKLLRKFAQHVAPLKPGSVVTKSSAVDLPTSCSFEVDSIFEVSEANSVFGFKIFKNSNGEEEHATVKFDTSNSTLSLTRYSTPEVEQAYSTQTESGVVPMYHDQSGKPEDVRIRMFVDKSVAEVYVNDKFVLTSRVYPLSKESCGAEFMVEKGNVRVQKMDVWTDIQSVYIQPEQDNLQFS